MCENGGTCVDGLGSYSCRCPAGFTGTSCETEVDECASQPCMNNATCHDYVDSFVCECVVGFSGRYCQMNDDDCTATSVTPPTYLCLSSCLVPCTPRRLYILCWRELSRHRLLPAVSPAAGRLTTPTVARLPVKISAQRLPRVAQFNAR